MKLSHAGRTNVGRKRNHNEDSFLILPDHHLYMVADGMGGHSAGEVASRMAVESVAQFFEETAKDDDVTWPYKMDKGVSYDENRFSTAIKLANLRIFETSEANEGQKGMGTTLVGSHFSDGTLLIGHVGDSRAYRVRDGTIEQLTEDHSLLNDYIKMKELTPEEIEAFPHKNVIVRALGMKDSVQVDINKDQPEPGDVYVLCSDGLSGMIEDSEILRHVVEHRDDLEAACDAMIAGANESGGTDNITAVIVRVDALD